MNSLISLSGLKTSFNGSPQQIEAISLRKPHGFGAGERSSSQKSSEPATGIHIELSPEAQKLLDEVSGVEDEGSQELENEANEAEESGEVEGEESNLQGLTEQDIKIIDQLKKTDAAVRAHEMAHMAAGGGLTSGPHYDYQTGPDKKRYVVGGHVDIDTSPGSTPEQTLMKAAQIKAAAMAPADPSPQDRAVAAQAGQMEEVARAQLAAENAEALKEGKEKAEEQSEEQSKTSGSTAPFGKEEQNNDKLGTRGKKAIKAYSAFIVSSAQSGRSLSFSA